MPSVRIIPIQPPIKAVADCTARPIPLIAPPAPANAAFIPAVLEPVADTARLYLATAAVNLFHPKEIEVCTVFDVIPSFDVA